MEPVAFTTDKMSWSFLLSAIQRGKAEAARLDKLEVNFEAPSCVILACAGIEAFVNEVASLTHAFLFEAQDGDDRGGHEALREVASIRLDGKGSWYDRYKCLVRELGVQNPSSLAELSVLKGLRDAFVHFRECDVPVVEDRDGAIRSRQQLPAPIVRLQRLKCQGRPLVAADDGVEWSLRVATNATVVWSLDLALGALLHVLDRLPPGTYRDFVRQSYASRDPSGCTVFELGRSWLSVWWDTRGRHNAEAL